MAAAEKITVPASLLDAFIKHQVNLGRYTNATVSDIIGLLNGMDKELVGLIQKAAVGSFTKARLEAMLKETHKLTAESYAVLKKTATDKLTAFGAHEATFTSSVLSKTLLDKIDIVTPSPDKLATLVTAQPFQGAILGEWFDKIALDKQHAITQAVRTGDGLGETIEQMVTRLTGTKAAGYADGILEIGRRNAEAVVRTAVNHVSNTTQQSVYKQNEDLMQGWTFVATLDTRTTITCASLSGTKWPVGEGPIPPRHFRCRSFALPLLKTWRQLGIDLNEIPASKRASIGGPVDADISFSDWLRTQDDASQNEILGKTRATLFRDGKLTVDKFADKFGNVLSLDQLAAKEAATVGKLFPDGMPGSGGGHLGKTIPVSGPMDFSHIQSPVLTADDATRQGLQAAASSRAQAARVAALTAQEQELGLAAGTLVNAPGEIGKFVGLADEATSIKTLETILSDLGVNNLSFEAKSFAGNENRMMIVGKTLTSDLERIHAEFPKVAQLMKSNQLETLRLVDVKILNDAGGKPGVTAGWYQANKKMMVLGTDQGKVSSGPQLGAWTIYKNMTGLLRHELGLHLAPMDVQKQALNIVFDKLKAEGSLLKHVSKYGATNASELFAEATSHYLSPNYVMGQFPKQLEELLIDRFGLRVIAKTAETIIAETVAKNAVADIGAEAAAFAKKWKAYKPQIKGKLVKGIPLSQAEMKILGEITEAEHATFMQAVDEAKAKANVFTATDKESLKDALLNVMNSKTLSEADIAIISKAGKGLSSDEMTAISAKALQEFEAAKKALDEAKLAYIDGYVNGKVLSDDMVELLGKLSGEEKALINAEAKAAKEALDKLAEESALAIEKALAEEAAINAAKVAAFDDALQKKWKAYKPQIKGKLVKGLDLTPAEKKILGDVPKHEYDDLMNKVDATMSSKTGTAVAGPSVPPPAPTTLSLDDFKKVGGKLGSNEGGTYVNKVTGEQFYIKLSASNDIAQNEVMATHLYKMAGVNATDMQLIDLGNGKWGVASRWIDGLEVNPGALQSGKLAGVYDGFGVDAWLANWDVVGQTYNNMKVLNGVTAVRVDPGGALFYRAQGGTKTLGNVVEELKSLRDASINSQSATVFAGMKQADLEAAIRRVLNIKESDIAATVHGYGDLWSVSQRRELVDTLIARQRYIAQQFPDLVEKTVEMMGKAVVSQDQFWAIRAARGNGVAVRVDYKQLEDQQILFHQERFSNGNDGIVGTFKVRAEGAKIMDGYVARAGGLQPGPTLEYAIKGITKTDIDGVSNSIIDTLKGVGAQAKNGESLRAKDIDRAKAAVAKLSDFWDKASLAGTNLVGSEWDLYHRDWNGLLGKIIKAGEGAPAKDFVPTKQFKAFEVPSITIPAPKLPESSEIKFFKKAGTFEKATIDKGNIIRSNIQESLSVGGENYFYEAEINGVKVRYWPKGDDSIAYSLQGRVQIITDGASKEAINKAISALDKIGLNVEIPALIQKEEMYLQKIAYHLNNSDYSVRAASIGNESDVTVRITRWKEYLNTKLGIKDITTLPDYKPDGTLEHFNQGNILLHRPDLQGPAWDAFTKEYRLHHSFWSGDYVGGFDRILDSGGKLAASTDRVRRGIPWGTSSASTDFKYGGADYVYTRVKTLSSSKSEAGITWRADNHLRRLDAISYSGDTYGQTKATNPVGRGGTPDAALGEDGFVLTNRAASNIKGWKNMAQQHSSNETIFKGGLSIFEDVEQIKVPREQYDKVLAIFRKHKITEWPDGRALTDVIVK